MELSRSAIRWIHRQLRKSATISRSYSADTATIDLRASRSLKFGGGKDAHAVTFGFDVFNLTNRVNYATYVGTVRSPLFRQPVSARAPRQLQFSLRATF